MGYNQPWAVGDAPENYTAALKRAIIGVEIRIESMGGKFKMSQELSEGDRQGVVNGFKEMDTPLARDMAKIVKERCELGTQQNETKKVAATVSRGW